MRAVHTVVVLLGLALLGLAPFAAALTSVWGEGGLVADTLAQPRLWRLLGGTVALGVATAGASALLGVPVAVWTVRRAGRLPALAAALVPLPLIVPPWILGVVWSRSVTMSGFGGATFLLTAALWPIVALFAMRGLRAAGTAGDAARLARGPRAALWRVELPLAWPSIASGMLLVFLFAITDFAIVDFLSFYDPEPFLVLSNEIFQKWARLHNAPQAAAVSLPAIAPSLVALGVLLRLERRQQGRYVGVREGGGAVRPLGVVGTLGLLVVTATTCMPPAVLVAWASRGDDLLGVARSAAPEMLNTAEMGVQSGLVIALLGVATARLGLRWGGWREALLLGAALVPLAAPGVMFGVGQIRLWNHPANPLSDVMYSSPFLLVLATSGRFLPLGVLAARAWLVRQDTSPSDAARLSRRTPLVRWLRVELPRLAPAVGLAATLGYLFTVRELDLITTIPAGTSTLSQKIFGFVHISSDTMTATLCVMLISLGLVPAVAARLLSGR